MREVLKGQPIGLPLYLLSAAALLEKAAQQIPEPAIARIVVKLAMPKLLQVNARSIKWRLGASEP